MSPGAVVALAAWLSFSVAVVIGFLWLCRRAPDENELWPPERTDDDFAFGVLIAMDEWHTLPDAPHKAAAAQLGTGRRPSNEVETHARTTEV